MENLSWTRLLVSPIELCAQTYPSFSNIQFEHVRRAHNKHADVLATLASKVDIPHEAVDVTVIKKILWAIAVELILVDPVKE